MNMKELKQFAAEVLFPQYNACHLCGRFPERADILCSHCRDQLNELRYGKLRTTDTAIHRPLERCLAAWPHRGVPRELVHLLKYASDSAAAEVLGEGMATALLLAAVQLQHIDTVVPVPLHASRLEQRGFNQALLLAQAVCAHVQLPLLDGALIRLHATDTQTRRDREERLLAMQHAFAVPDAKAVQGLQLLLVDDVLTTGATAISCAHALLDAGAASVSLLTACRV